MVWVEQETGVSKRKVTPTNQGDDLEKHLCKGNMHLCCHLCRFSCKSMDYEYNFGRNNIIVDCKRICERFEVR